MRRKIKGSNLKKENRKIDNFLVDIFKVFKKHKMTLSHEDTQGAFIIMDYDKGNINWLRDATDGLYKVVQHLEQKKP